MKKNLFVQLLSLVFLAFTFSGLAIDPDTAASTIVNHLSDKQFIALAIYLLVNVGNIFVHWIEQLKEDSTKFWKFTESVNFWLGFANVVTALVLLTTGITIDPDAVHNFVVLIFNQEYWSAATVFLANILIPVIKSLIGREKRK